MRPHNVGGPTSLQGAVEDGVEDHAAAMDPRPSMLVESRDMGLETLPLCVR